MSLSLLCYIQLNMSHLKQNLYLTFLLTTFSFPGAQTLAQRRLGGAHTYWFHRVVSLCLGRVPSPGQRGLVLSPLHRDICKSAHDFARPSPCLLSRSGQGIFESGPSSLSTQGLSPQDIRSCWIPVQTPILESPLCEFSGRSVLGP